jgi:hypothetical protein
LPILLGLVEGDPADRIVHVQKGLELERNDLRSADQGDVIRQPGRLDVGQVGPQAAEPIPERLAGSVVEDHATIGRYAGVVTPMGHEALDGLADLVRCLGWEDDGPPRGGDVRRVNVVG